MSIQPAGYFTLSTKYQKIDQERGTFISLEY